MTGESGAVYWILDLFGAVGDGLHPQAPASPLSSRAETGCSPPGVTKTGLLVRPVFVSPDWIHHRDVVGRDVAKLMKGRAAMRSTRREGSANTRTRTKT